jgi:deoxycytidine triphosphate deaminase
LPSNRRSAGQPTVRPLHCHVLVDHQLEQMVSEGRLVKRLYSRGLPFEHDSAIQPASIDLHIGAIFVPERQEKEPGGLRRPRTKHSLAPGHSVMITTKEKLDVPLDVTGMGFPLARMSSSGLLMTNPGHIDPGYKGSMTFTAINMGRLPFELREGDPIVTVMLFRLDAPVTAIRHEISRRATEHRYR